MLFSVKNFDSLPGKWHLDSVLDAKLECLQGLLKSYGSCLIAYSGGVDSVFLAHVANLILGEKSLAAIADSASLPRRELQEALDLGRQFGFPVRILKTNEFNNAEYLANPSNRCYFCKSELFSELEPLARREGFAVIAYGENASDVGDFRPGAKAAAEFEIRAPLKEVGLTKPEIRQLSARFGLPTADKPQMACLSSRIPHGEPVNPVKLSMIEQGEYILRDLGFHDVRVRHHELKTGNLARIEVGKEELSKMFSAETFAQVAESFRKLGYAHTTLDLEGYRRAGLSPAVPADLRILAK